MWQSERLGWIDNVNDLLKRAQGDYCVFAFHDDVFEPDYVTRLVACLEAQPAAILAYTDMDTLYFDGTYHANRSPDFAGTANRVERASLVIRREADWWTPHRGLFRLFAEQQTGGLKRHLAGEFAADWPWLLSLALLGDFVASPRFSVTNVSCARASRRRGGRGGMRRFVGFARPFPPRARFGGRAYRHWKNFSSGACYLSKYGNC